MSRPILRTYRTKNWPAYIEALIRNGQSIAALARSEGCSEGHIRSRLTLAFLAPSLQRAILAGRVPAQWTTDYILDQSLPFDWAAQTRLLGF